MTRNKLKELFTLIGVLGKLNWKTSLINNRITFIEIQQLMFVENQILQFNNNNTNNRLIYKNISMKRNNGKNIIKNKTTILVFLYFIQIKK
jgi:hypothetical protein